ncbi:MAG: hypothetical protein WC686_05805 [Candidatus Shapirobacteria bacterium]|jgi:hypothetical protein
MSENILEKSVIEPSSEKIILKSEKQDSNIGKGDLELLANKYELKGGIPEDGSEAMTRLTQACVELNDAVKALETIDKSDFPEAEKRVMVAYQELKLMFIYPDDDNLKGFAREVAESL